MNKSTGVYINRELSWLDFNQRVLELSQDDSLPLAEQMRFAAIYGSNLDEFFMVRVGSLYDRTLLKKEITECRTHMTAAEQLAQIMPRTAQLQCQCDENIHRLEERLLQQNCCRVDFKALDQTEEAFWKRYFTKELYPLLSPQILDRRHPFPFLQDREIYLAVILHGDEPTCGLIPLGQSLDRMIYRKVGNTLYYAITEELVLHFADRVFPKELLMGKCLFRVTRNADIDVKEGMFDQDIDYRKVMSELIQKRRKQAAVRLQFWKAPPPEIREYLCERLVLPREQCFVQSSALDLSYLFKLANDLHTSGRKNLFYPTVKPVHAPAGYNLMQTAEKQDVLIAYPYQSMQPFLRMLMDAAVDPAVVSIRITLYRLAPNSQIVHALCTAAENGKRVTAVVELRARFDEQNNIEWSRRLEQAGCTVVYGLNDYKVHSKLLLITRKTPQGFEYITQVGTGNYNEKTSKLYTDLSFVTSKREIGQEAAVIFHDLVRNRVTSGNRYLLTAPLCFKSVLLEEMEREIQKAKQGKPARIILKNNSISDQQVIRTLFRASQAGVSVDMIVRGICCVCAGIPGKTENIRIRSIVGRYLEHGRIYAFGEGDDLRIYLASGDFLTRNTERRVEVGVRVEDPTLKQTLWQVLQIQLADNVNAWEMQPDGHYEKVLPPNDVPVRNSHIELYKLFENGFFIRE